VHGGQEVTHIVDADGWEGALGAARWRGRHRRSGGNKRCTLFFSRLPRLLRRCKRLAVFGEATVSPWWLRDPSPSPQPLQLQLWVDGALAKACRWREVAQAVGFESARPRPPVRIPLLLLGLVPIRRDNFVLSKPLVIISSVATPLGAAGAAPPAAMARDERPDDGNPTPAASSELSPSEQSGDDEEESEEEEESQEEAIERRIAGAIAGASLSLSGEDLPRVPPSLFQCLGGRA